MSRIILSEADFNEVLGTCKICGSDAISYLCNSALIAVRPEGAREDYWLSCANPDCKNHYGEGYLQELPDWLFG